MKRTAMVVFSYFPDDPRVRREADALIEAGFSIDIICLKNRIASKNKPYNGVNIFRINIDRKRGSLFRYLFEYTYFIFVSSIILTYLHLKNPYRIIHIHNLPDILVLSAFLPKLMGAKIILDMHEIMPEIFMKKYALPERHFVIRMLKILEKISIRMTNHVIVATPFLKHTVKKRSAKNGSVTTILNLPDPKVFLTDTTESKSIDESFRIVYPGTLDKMHGIDIAIKAMHRVIKTEHLPIELHFYGAGPVDETNAFTELVKSLKLENSVFFYDSMPLEELLANIKNMDAGIVPKRDGVFIGEALSGKLFDFAYMGIPTIVSRTPGDSYYFDDSMVMFFEPENISDLSEKIVKLYKDPTLRKQYADNAKNVFLHTNWNIMKEHLYGIYLNLNAVAELNCT